MWDSGLLLSKENPCDVVYYILDVEELTQSISEEYDAHIILWENAVGGYEAAGESVGYTGMDHTPVPTIGE